MTRRDFVRVGTIGFLGLSLSMTDLLRMQSAFAANGAGPRKGRRRRR
jgi:uridine phosphorylase